MESCFKYFYSAKWAVFTAYASLIGVFKCCACWTSLNACLFFLHVYSVSWLESENSRFSTRVSRVEHLVNSPCSVRINGCDIPLPLLSGLLYLYIWSMLELVIVALKLLWWKSKLIYAYRSCHVFFFICYISFSTCKHVFVTCWRLGLS